MTLLRLGHFWTIFHFLLFLKQTNGHELYEPQHLVIPHYHIRIIKFHFLFPPFIPLGISTSACVLFQSSSSSCAILSPNCSTHLFEHAPIRSVVVFLEKVTGGHEHLSTHWTTAITTLTQRMFCHFQPFILVAFVLAVIFFIVLSVYNTVKPSKGVTIRFCSCFLFSLIVWLFYAVMIGQPFFGWKILRRNTFVWAVKQKEISDAKQQCMRGINRCYVGTFHLDHHRPKTYTNCLALDRPVHAYVRTPFNRASIQKKKTNTHTSHITLCECNPSMMVFFFVRLVFEYFHCGQWHESGSISTNHYNTSIVCTIDVLLFHLFSPLLHSLCTIKIYN